MALYHSAKGSVNYTVVGSPTIVNGVASGFSVNDFVVTQQGILLSSTDKLETVIKLNFNTLESIRNYIVYVGSYFALFTYNSKFGCSFQDSVSGWSHRFTLGDTLSVNTDYWVKVYYEEGSLVLSLSTDGSNYTTFATISTTISSMSSPDTFMFGYPLGTNDNYMHGSIDFNKTYIKVNGAPWFGVCPVEVKHINFGTTVGYTKVGSPTISNGVVSGFSGSDYLTTIFRPGANPWEMVIKFKTPSSFGSWQALAAKQGDVRFATQLSNTGYIQTVIVASSAGTKTINGNVLQTNTDYWLKLVFDGSAYTQYISTDGINYSVDGTPQETTYAMNDSNDPLLFGVGRQLSNILQSSIDLNQTYIKVNGKLWFFRPCTNYQVHNGKLVFADSGLYLSGPVNYTVVGNPTIVDGVASGFSSSDYLKTTSLPDLNNDFELVIKWNTTTSSNIQNLMGWVVNGYMCGVALLSNNKIALVIGRDSANRAFVDGVHTYSANTDTWLKLIRNGSTLSLYYSLDGSNYILDAYENIPEKLGTFVVESYFRIGVNGGYTPGSVFAGSIDLNSTYIKVNGNLWFYGKNYASQNIAPVPSGYTYGNTTTSAIGFVDMRTQAFTGAPVGATLGKDE